MVREQRVLALGRAAQVDACAGDGPRQRAPASASWSSLALDAEQVELTARPSLGGGSTVLVCQRSRPCGARSRCRRSCGRRAPRPCRRRSFADVAGQQPVSASHLRAAIVPSAARIAASPARSRVVRERHLGQGSGGSAQIGQVVVGRERAAATSAAYAITMTGLPAPSRRRPAVCSTSRPVSSQGLAEGRFLDDLAAIDEPGREAPEARCRVLVAPPEQDAALPGR